jgi:DNA-binding MarR family transcriptional regulator
MENSLHHLLMTNHTAFRKRIFSALKNEGLTSGQPKVLEYLSEHNGAMQKDIAAACRIEPATMTSLLCGMEKKGLITRSAPDRRSLSVYLTDKGKALVPLIEQEFARIESVATNGFSDDEREMLVSLLSRMRENLN